MGEGGALSAIVAGAPMHAVLNFSANNSAAYGAAAPEPTEMQYLGDVSIDGEHDRLRSTSRAAAFSRRDAVCVAGAGLANYSVFAPGIARSRFERVSINGARSVGLSIGYGALPSACSCPSC